MTLPNISEYIPKVELPFDIPTLLHPSLVHFMVAIPVVILLLELINLIMRKKAISGVSIFLLVLTVVVSAAVYLTGLVDGKAAYSTLSDLAKSDLAEHKLLGTYLLVAPVVVLFFKLISSLMNSVIVKALYLLVLIAFVLGIFQQGNDGGKLVYTHGMNVSKLKTLDDQIFDLEEELEEAEEALEEAEAKIGKSEKKIEAPVVAPITAEVIQAKTPEETTPVETIGNAVPATQEVVEAVKAESLPYTEPVQVEQMPEAVQQVQIPTH